MSDLRSPCFNEDVGVVESSSISRVSAGMDECGIMISDPAIQTFLAAKPNLLLIVQHQATGKFLDWSECLFII